MRIILLSILVMLTQQTFAQDYMQKITKKACDCSSKIPEKYTGNQKTMRLGLCIMKASSGYTKELKRDYGINMNKTSDQRKLGEMLGKKMAMECPDILLSMLSDEDVDEIVDQSAEDAEVEEGMTTGKVLNIDNKNFVVFEIKNNAVNTSKYYLFGKIETDIKDFNNSYFNLVGDQIEIEYEKQLFFDPQLNDYRNYKVIKTINRK